MLQVLQGLRMRVIPDMPALVLTETQQLQGLSEHTMAQDLASYKESVLLAVAEVEKALGSATQALCSTS